ncbi:MAG: hypothetical protein ACLQVY_11055 [Limisphaerales bacterium]
MTNCIVYYNFGWALGANAAAYCCTPSALVGPAVVGPGNFTNAPQFQADGVLLSGGSPCIGAGTNLVTGTDIIGMPCANPPSMGCSEVVVSNLVGPLSVAICDFFYLYQTNAVVALPSPSLASSVFFYGTVTGRAASVSWNFGDGPAITNAGYSKF